MTETATPEVIPGPEEISLELGSDGQIVFVSDVHLTGGGPVAGSAGAAPDEPAR